MFLFILVGTRDDRQIDNPPVKRKLVILEGSGVLWSSRKEKTAPSPGTSSSRNHVHHIKNGNADLLLFERLRLHQFLAKCFEIFDVAIWTSVGPTYTQTIVQTIFTQDELSKFKFIWDGSHCSDSTVPRDDMNCNVLLKDLRLVWVDKFPGVYDDSNTILIDVSPMKTFQNPEFTSLYPPIFKFGDCTDTFLIHILWPLLHKLSFAVDVRRFISINMPKWSLKNSELDRKKHADLYVALKECVVVTMPTVPKYTILDVSDLEVTWKEKRLIDQLPPRWHKGCTKERVHGLVLLLLGRLYEGPYRDDPLQFISDIEKIRYSGSRKFTLTGPVTECTRDMVVDQDRKKLTCSNIRCKDC